MLFQFHEKQDEDCPDSDRHGELCRLRLLQRASSRDREREAEHCYRGKYSKEQFAFPVHRRFPSPSGFAHVPVEVRQSCWGGCRHSTLESRGRAIIETVPGRSSWCRARIAVSSSQPAFPAADIGPSLTSGAKSAHNLLTIK